MEIKLLQEYHSKSAWWVGIVKYKDLELYRTGVAYPTAKEAFDKVMGRMPTIVSDAFEELYKSKEIV